MRLHVVDHEPTEWFLLRDSENYPPRDEYYLDVNCNAGPIGFSLLVKLTETDRQEYGEAGRAYIEYLAKKIMYRPESYRDRDVTSLVGSEAGAAIMSFKRTAGTNPEPGAR